MKSSSRSNMLLLLAVLCLLCRVSFAQVVINAPTPWSTIGSTLVRDWASSLPTIPSTPLQVDWNVLNNNPFQVISLGLANAADTCGVPPSNPSFPNNVIHFGSVQTNANQSYCRVIKNPTYNLLDFRNRWRTGNIYVPVTAHPTWIQARFVIPPGGNPTRVTLKLDARYPLRMYGGNPCPAAATNSSYLCRILTEGPWDRSVQAGYWVLWTTPGSTGYIVTGPHKNITQDVSVPSQVAGASEIIITMFAYNQYPSTAECGTSCGEGNPTSTSLSSLQLEIRAPFSPPRTPPNSHPRLFGVNTEWYPRIKAFDNFPCTDRRLPWGGVADLRHHWNKMTWGGSSCDNSLPSTLRNHAVAAKYFNNEAARVPTLDALNLFHLIRRTRHCLSIGASDCRWTQADLTQLVPLVINKELSHFSAWIWENHGLGFDLGTQDPMRFWCVFVDIFWSDLTTAQKTTINTAMNRAINAFINEYNTRHWALFNGNNWTPFLAVASTYWAITFYHEDARAPEVLRMTLDVLWLHRKAFYSDGAYEEGVAQYSFMSLDSTVEIQLLLNASFGMTSDFMDREALKKFPRWHLDSLASDGYMVDFSDSHEASGWTSFSTLYAAYWHEIAGGQANPVDPCLLREYWMNKYFDQGMRNAWILPGNVLLKNWTQLISQCQPSASTDTRVAFYPKIKYAAIRTDTKPVISASLAKTDQSNQIFFAIQGKDSTAPHTELDFGTFIWAAFGNRLVSDLGYGTIGGTEEDKYTSLDNNPRGHSTLVVENANGASATENRCQIYGQIGEFSHLSVNGFETVMMDGSAIYGKDQAQGWLSQMYRYFISVHGGHVILLDCFKAHSSRGTLSVSEYFYSDSAATPQTTCSSTTVIQITQEVASPHRALLKPDCGVLRAGASTVRGVVAAASMGGQTAFVSDGAVTYALQSGTGRRNRLRYTSTQPIAQDVRLFTLAADNSTNMAVTATYEASSTSFLVTIAANKYRIQVEQQSGVWVLKCISFTSGTSAPAACTPNTEPVTTGVATTGTRPNGVTTGVASETRNDIDSEVSPATFWDWSVFVLLSALVVALWV